MICIGTNSPPFGDANYLFKRRIVSC